MIPKKKTRWVGDEMGCLHLSIFVFSQGEGNRSGGKGRFGGGMVVFVVGIRRCHGDRWFCEDLLASVAMVWYVLFVSKCSSAMKVLWLFYVAGTLTIDFVLSLTCTIARVCAPSVDSPGRRTSITPCRLEACQKHLPLIQAAPPVVVVLCPAWRLQLMQHAQAYIRAATSTPRTVH